MSTSSLAASYAQPWIACGYDLLSRAVFAPVGGLDALRELALDHMQLSTGMQVLELGCGSGGFTAKLVERGASVTAVDRSEPMLRRARQRAPRASFERSELTAYVPTRRYARVLFGFVLHELDADGRQRALQLASRALESNGAIVIVDHALPSHGLMAKAVSACVHGFEPATTRAWLRDGYDAELARAGLIAPTKRSLAQGTAVAMLCRPLN